MKKTKVARLALTSDTIRDLSAAQLRVVVGGDGDVVTNTEIESIVYWCPSNTSIQRSCASSCGIDG
jgi:hypothetical protein